MGSHWEGTVWERIFEWSLWWEREQGLQARFPAGHMSAASQGCSLLSAEYVAFILPWSSKAEES